MARNLTHNQQVVFDQLAAQRWQAEQAVRTVADWERVAWEAALEWAGQLALEGHMDRSRIVMAVALIGQGYGEEV